MFAGVIIQTDPGKTVRVECSNDLSSGSWTTLTQLVLPSSPYTYYAADSPNHSKRLHRASNERHHRAATGTRLARGHPRRQLISATPKFA
jgi:hypothetical protein